MKAGQGVGAGKVERSGDGCTEDEKEGDTSKK